MTELITITEQNGQRAVSARELYKFLEVTERFSNWFERQLQYGFTENIDYQGCKIFNTQANQELTDYALSIDCAKEISMLQRTEKGKLARLYFIEMEKRAKEPQAKAIGYGAKINALPVEQRERALIDLVKEERFELICLIRQYMKRGDMAKTAKELGYNPSSVQDVMLGRQWNESIVKAMHQKAMQNKQEALFDVRGMINELNQ